MRRIWVPIIAGIFLIAVATTAFQIRTSTKSSKDTSALAVVMERDMNARIVASGIIQLSTGARVNVGARSSGVVKKLHVHQGSSVKTGDLIAELDDREAKLQLANSEASLAEAIALYEKARLDTERFSPLLKSGYTTQSEFDNMSTIAKQAEARVASARVAVNLARVQLDHMTIRAPIDGIVASVSTQEGETIAASFSAPTFVTLIDPTKLECIAYVDETDIGRITTGYEAEFTVDGYPGRYFEGKVARIAPDATVINGVVNYETTILVSDSTGLLRPQMTANVTILGPSQSATVIPTASVRQSSNGAYVWKHSAGSNSRVAIRTGARHSDFTEVIAGLSIGDSVLASSFPDAPDTR